MFTGSKMQVNYEQKVCHQINYLFDRLNTRILLLLVLQDLKEDQRRRNEGSQKECHFSLERFLKVVPKELGCCFKGNLVLELLNNRAI